MNKQQLASTIWESANQMRSKIEANEYKDFILGFIFYKYLSNAIQLSIISVVFCHREPLFFMPKNFKNITKNS